MDRERGEEDLVGVDEDDPLVRGAGAVTVGGRRVFDPVVDTHGLVDEGA